MEAVLRRHGAYGGADLSAGGRIGAVRDVLAAVVPGALADVDALGDAIGPELDAYGEFMASAEAPVAGVLVRGEGAGFTRRVAALLDDWGMPEESRRFHATLAEAFEHKRVFLKLEWQRAAKTERQVAVYYRRRPRVHDALKLLAAFTGTCLRLQDFRELGALLGKDTVHFVAFTTRADAPLQYKFYFSQYLTPDSYAAADHRLQRCVQRFVGDSPAVTRWLAYRDMLAPRHREQTLFVSLAQSEDGGDGSLKIDYPDVAPLVAAGLLDGRSAAQAEERLRWLCEAAGRDELSYLGLRLGAGAHPVLKGYADLP